MLRNVDGKRKGRKRNGHTARNGRSLAKATTALYVFRRASGLTTRSACLCASASSPVARRDTLSLTELYDMFVSAHHDVLSNLPRWKRLVDSVLVDGRWVREVLWEPKGGDGGDGCGVASACRASRVRGSGSRWEGALGVLGRFRQDRLSWCVILTVHLGARPSHGGFGKLPADDSHQIPSHTETADASKIRLQPPHTEDKDIVRHSLLLFAVAGVYRKSKQIKRKGK